jgi:hypothetical protein
MVRVAPLLQPWSAGLRQQQTRSPRGSPHERRAGLTDVGVLEPRSLWHCCSESAKNDSSRWSRGLGRRYFYSPRRGGILTKQRTPLSSTPSNTMSHSGTNQQVRFSCLVPPSVSPRRVVSASPALSIKVCPSILRANKFVTLHRATTSRRLEATTPETGSPTIASRLATSTTTTPEMGSPTIATGVASSPTTTRRTTRTAAGLAPTPRPPAT